MTRVERQADEAGRYREAPHLLDIASFHSMRIWSDFLIVQCLMNLLPSLSHFDKLFPHKSKLHKHKDPPPNKNNKNWRYYCTSLLFGCFFLFYIHIYFYIWAITSCNTLLFFFFTSPVPGGRYLHKKINDFAKIQVFPVKKCPFCFVERRV